MKTIILDAQQFDDVPDWVSWVAKDANGNRYGYETEPCISKGRHWSGGRCVLLEHHADNWRDSKVRV